MKLLRRPFLSPAGGFSLVEVMAAITVFAVITLGITPLLVSSLRGTDLSRSFTRSKNLVQEAMERVRGFPYFDTGVNRDVLDLYFPDLTAGAGGSGYIAATQSFVTICTPTSSLPATTGPSACPARLGDGTPRIPAGHTMRFEAQFVVPTGTASESFTVQTPTAGYTSADPALAIPPAQLMRITITMSWSQIGRPRQFSLVSLVGDRKLSPDKARANATIDFVVEGITSYRRLSDGKTSRLTVSAGRSTADVEIRNLASAAVESTAGRLSLFTEESGGVAGQEVANVTGATSPRITAPPTQSPLTPITDTDTRQTVQHPDLSFTIIAFLADGSKVFPSDAPASSVQVTNNLPSSVSRFLLDPSAGLSMWADNQADTSSTALRKLSPLPNDHVLSVAKKTGVRLNGFTQAFATSTTPAASRKVEAVVTSGFGRLELLPTTFILGLDQEKGVIVIDDFTSSLTCTSTGVAASSAASGRWDATFRYWADVNNDGLQNGGYVTVTSGDTEGKISGSTSSTWADALSALKAVNPRIYDTAGNSSDVFLFEDDTTVPPKIGYLTELSSAPLISSLKTDTVARVSMEQAISIVTAQTDPLNPETALTVKIGKASCEAGDRRG